MFLLRYFFIRRDDTWDKNKMNIMAIAKISTQINLYGTKTKYKHRTKKAKNYNFGIEKIPIFVEIN